MRACLSTESVSPLPSPARDRITRRLVSVALGVCVASTGLNAAAAPADEPPDAGESDDDAAPNEAQVLYDKGRVAFETADYAAAVAAWTEAYGSVDDTPQGARIKALLIYNIATARERVFDVSQDPAELRQARILLKDFEASIPQLYAADDIAAEQERVQKRIAAVDALLAETQATDSTDDQDPAPAPVVVDDPPEPNQGRPFIIAGAVTLGVGVAALGLMGAGLGLGSGANDLSDLADDDIAGRRDQFARGRTGNTLAIVGGALGGVATIAGAVLIGVGASKNKRGKVAVTGGPGLVGLGLRGRF